MADIFSGKELTLQYNTDTGNRSPQGIGNVTINNVTEFPALTIQSETNNFETYDNEYKTVLLSDKSVEPFDIVVTYLPDDPTHQFLDEMAESQSVFQVIIQYQLDLEESQITYAIVNGYVTGTQLSGDKDQVVTKSYSFTPADVVARVMTMAALLPVYQGDYGVGANTTGIPQYAPVTPTGNSFIKVPSTQAGNPAGADMMGIGLVDGSSVAEFAMTKTGTLSLFAKNATTAWTRIYTATQMDARYVPLTRTVNGKALTADITLTSTDTGSVPRERTVNGYELSDDVVLTKQDIELENVTNDAQLKISSNLADIDDSEIARTNLDVYSKDEIDSNIDEVNNSINILTTHVNTDFVPKTITVNGHPLSSNVTVTKTDLGLGSIAVQNANTVAITGGTATLSTLTLSTALPLTSGGTGAITAAAARTNLGLGTAATVNVGTSGGTVPLLNATNTWGGAQTFTSIIQGNVSGTASNVTGIVSIDNGGTGAISESDARTNLNAFKFDRNVLTGDLNTYDGNNSGVYFQNSSDAATLDNHYPVNSAGSLLVMTNGTNSGAGCTQVYYLYNSNNVYVRTNVKDTGWTTWQLLLKDDIFNTNNTWTHTQYFAGMSIGAEVTGASGVEIGSLSTASTSFVDLHSSGTGNDYDVRFAATGGASASGNGTLTVNAGSVNFSSEAKFGAGAITIPYTALATSGAVGIGGYRGIEAGSDTASFDNMNNLNLTSWYGIGFCTTYPSPTGGVIAGKPAAFINTRNGNFYARNAVFSNTTQLTSDRNAKENIEIIQDDQELIDKVLGLKTYTFNFKNSGQPSAGFIAQDVQEVFPEYVQYIEDINHLSLDYTAINAYLHKAVVHYVDKNKQLETIVTNQQIQIDELKVLVQSLIDNK